LAGVQIGEPIRDGWDIYKRFWQHLLPIALITYLIFSLLTLVFTWIGGFFGGLAGLVIAVAGIFLLQAALVEAVADVRDGRADLTLSETLTRVWPRLGSVVLAGVLAAIAIGVGLVIFIVPGLILLTFWSVIVPVIVLEGVPALESFGRSRALVRGYGWTVFGVVVVTGIIGVLATVVLQIVLSGLSTSLDHYLSNVIANTIITPFTAATWTSMYFRLRVHSEPPTVPAGAAYTDA
jgi:hypothetical protein